MKILWQHATVLSDAQKKLDLTGFDKETLATLKAYVNETTNWRCVTKIDFRYLPTSEDQHNAARVGANFIIRKGEELSRNDDWATYIIYGFNKDGQLRFANQYRSAKFTDCNATSSNNDLVLHCEGGDGDDTSNYKVIFDTRTLDIKHK